MSKKSKTLTLILAVVVVAAGIMIFTDKHNEPVPDFSKVDEFRLEWFEGTWECEENPLNDPDHFTGYIMLKFDEKGGFRLYDGETDNTYIQGFVTLSGDSHLVMTCNGEGEFNPPPTWDTMGMVEEMKYKIKYDDKLYITYNEDRRIRSTLIFSREDQV